MKLGIIGGGNCYALNLANYAHKEGWDVFGIGRSQEKAPAMWQVYKGYRYYRVHIVTKLKAVLTILAYEMPDVIVNFAAQGEGQGSFGHQADLFYRTNTLGLVRLVEGLRMKPWLSRFIQVSTSELYGSVTAPSKENAPIKPTSPYAVSKAAFDMHLEVMHRVHGFPMNIIRPSNAYCPGQQLHRIIPKAIIYALSGKKLTLNGGGLSEKTYIHATDLSDAILKTIEGPVGATYNCGADEPVSIKNVVELCAKACGVMFNDLAVVGEQRLGEDGRYWLDSSKIKALGWKQRISLVGGIEEMVNWIGFNPEILTMSTDWKVTP